MMKRISTFCTAALLGVVFALPVIAAPSPATDSFVKNAMIGGTFEIESSKLALTKTQSPKVKEFAQKMIDDHTEASTRLKGVLNTSQAYPAAVSGQLDDKHQKIMDSLNAASGSSFDTQYIDAQKLAHQEAVSLFQAYAANGDDTALKGYAETTLPTLKAHQQHITNLTP